MSDQENTQDKQQDITQQEVEKSIADNERELEQAEHEGEVLTKVTSIAEEEEKSGQKMQINAEQLVTAASINMTKTLYQLEKLLKSMKAKRIVEAVIGGLDFPKDNMPVKWVDKTGKPRDGYMEVINAFMMIQRVISDRYVLTQKHVIEQAKKYKESQDAAEKLIQKGKELEESTEKSSEDKQQSTKEEKSE